MNNQKSSAIEIGWLGVVTGRIEQVAAYALRVSAQLKQECHFIFNRVQVEINQGDNVTSLTKQYHEKYIEGRFVDNQRAL